MLVHIPGRKEALDGVLEVGNTAKHAASHRLAVDDGKPRLDLVHLTGTGGREVEVEALVVCQPVAHLGKPVGAVVVEHEVKLEPRVADVDQLQEAQELLVAMACVAAPGDLAAGDVEGGEQRRRAMANVVVGAALHLAAAERQERLGAVECLDLTLLVDMARQRAPSCAVARELGPRH